nr:erythromycin esterase family protein [Lysinibacillus timonensis]
MTFSKGNTFLLAALLFSACLYGCMNNDVDDKTIEPSVETDKPVETNETTKTEELEKYISTIQAIDIPDDVEVIGLGEATHGNVELQELKRDVFEALINNENVRVFVLEGDFGAGQQINQFILNDIGSAKEVVYALDYNIYKTEQMIDLVQWMHDYNLTASDNEKIYFYGNDMQRYDDSKQGLLDYYEVVNIEAAKTYAEQLKHVSNATMRDLTPEQYEEMNEVIEQIILDLQSNEKVYSEQSSPDAFAFALQYAHVLKQRTQLFLNESNYTQLRDQYLADNLQWIVEFEAERGHDKVLITAHNGHIEQSSASLAGYKSMGNYLDERFGPAYFAIGTDLIKSEFQALNSQSGEREIHTLENHNDLVDAFREMDSNIFYIDFENASKSEELAEILTKKQRMMNIGDDFASWYKLTKSFYTIEMIPNEAYDGVIIVKEATPTSVLE